MKHVVLAVAASLALAVTAVAQTNPQAAAPAAAPAATADITGKWDMTVTTAQGSIVSVMVLKKDGDKIVGTISSAEYGETPLEAEVKGKDVGIYFSIQTGNGPLNIAFYGTAEKDSMKGTADLGQMGQIEWAAKRSPAPAAAPGAAPSAAPADSAAKLDLTGTWNFQVTTEAGSGSPTVTLKQEGEKLTGQYSGQFGQAPLTGTVKGSDVRFEFDISVEGNTAHIVYTGTVDKDTIKGTAQFGDMGSGTFTGTRKK
jgi:hypothetical protein